MRQDHDQEALGCAICMARGFFSRANSGPSDLYCAGCWGEACNKPAEKPPTSYDPLVAHQLLVASRGPVGAVLASFFGLSSLAGAPPGTTLQ